MKLFLLLTSALVLFSCASKPVVLKTHEYDLKDTAKFTVNFLKDKSNRMDIGLLGISTKEDAVVIKKDEIICGKGTEAGVISKFAKAENDPFIVLPKAIFKEFVIVCKNPNFATIIGNAYLEIKNIYAFTDGQPGKVLVSDIKIELK